MPVIRNLARERESLKAFGESQGKMPSTTEDWALLAKMTYGTDLPTDLPDDVKKAVAASTPSAGIASTATPTTDPGTTGMDTSGIAGLKKDVATAKGAYQQYVNPDTGMGATYAQKTLEDAIRTKTQASAAPLGESAIFKQAGVGGMGALAYSLNARKQEMAQNATVYQNTIQTYAGMYKDKAQSLLDNYTLAIGQYNKEADRLQKIEDVMTDHQNALDLIDAETKASNARTAFEHKLQLDTETPETTPSQTNGIVIEQGSGNTYECGYWARTKGDYAGGSPMGDTLANKINWVNKYGTKGTEGIGVGDLVITNGADVSATGAPLSTGHALIVGSKDQQGNIYAYESNANGNFTVTFGRLVDPSTIYGYVSGNMNPSEFKKMQSYAMSINPANLMATPIEEAISTKPIIDSKTGKLTQEGVGYIAQAIINGEQPPDLKGMYGQAAAIKAELAKQKFDLSKANLDWVAQTSYLKTLNASQQVRLRQAVTFAYDSLDIVDELSKEWQGGTYPVLNRAKLKAAKEGLLGVDAQSIATRLDSQISDLVSELATVYKGGNSSTDDSLALAAKQLSSDWTYKQLKDAVELVRTNLKIRQNSLKTTGVAGINVETTSVEGQSYQSASGKSYNLPNK